MSASTWRAQSPARANSTLTRSCPPRRRRGEHVRDFRLKAEATHSGTLALWHSWHPGTLGTLGTPGTLGTLAPLAPCHPGTLGTLAPWHPWHPWHPKILQPV